MRFFFQKKKHIWSVRASLARSGLRPQFQLLGGLAVKSALQRRTDGGPDFRFACKNYVPPPQSEGPLKHGSLSERSSSSLPARARPPTSLRPPFLGMLEFGPSSSPRSSCTRSSPSASCTGRSPSSPVSMADEPERPFSSMRGSDLPPQQGNPQRVGAQEPRPQRWR
jgi:hypothetical protein